MKFNLLLATLDVVPAYVAQVSIMAGNRVEAVEKALAEDFEEMEWQDHLGNVVPWEEIGSSDVAVAED